MSDTSSFVKTSLSEDWLSLTSSHSDDQTAINILLEKHRSLWTPPQASATNSAELLDKELSISGKRIGMFKPRISQRVHLSKFEVTDEAIFVHPYTISAAYKAIPNDQWVTDYCFEFFSQRRKSFSFEEMKRQFELEALREERA